MKCFYDNVLGSASFALLFHIRTLCGAVLQNLIAIPLNVTRVLWPRNGSTSAAIKVAVCGKSIICGWDSAWLSFIGESYVVRKVLQY